MDIRRFEIGDEGSLRRVFHSAIHLIASQNYSQQQIEAWAPDDVDMDGWRRYMQGLAPFVVEFDGDVVGYADLQANGYIDHFFVSGHHPRRGIGSLLMRRIHEETAALALHELTSNVSRSAEPFFFRFGFDVVERREPVVRGVAIPNALMRKGLPAPLYRSNRVSA